MRKKATKPYRRLDRAERAAIERGLDSLHVDTGRSRIKNSRNKEALYHRSSSTHSSKVMESRLRRVCQ